MNKETETLVQISQIVIRHRHRNTATDKQISEVVVECWQFLNKKVYSITLGDRYAAELELLKRLIPA